MLDGAIDRVDEPRHRLGDRLADRRAEHGEDRGGDLLWVAADRFADRAFHGRRQRDAELPIAIRALHDRLRQMLGDLLGRQLERIESAAKLVELPTFAAEQQIAEFGELANA